MDPAKATSSALVRKRTDTDLMPPPPPAKKIKRPKTVLDEDTYTEALSQIIQRDFFPGLAETDAGMEYLDALASKDEGWKAEAGRRLQQAMTPARQRPASSVLVQSGSQTPSAYGADTPASVAASAQSEGERIDTSMSLAAFQAKYTSEDNESFYKLVDRQNQKRVEKHNWVWNGNKLPSKQMLKQKEVEDRLLASRGTLADTGYGKKDRLAIKDSDDRPAQPDTWNSNPINGLMFKPDGVDPEMVASAEKPHGAAALPPKSINYHNTRMPQPHVPVQPPSPTMSAVRDAIAGRPRREDMDSDVGGGETPRVNGYAFVDDEEEESLSALPAPVIDLGPGDATPNPFKIQEQRNRESLHHRMVEKISKSKRESAKNGLIGRVEKTPVPKFPSSPKVSGGLTPAGERLWSKLGASPARAKGLTGSTPLRPRGSLLKSVSKPS